MSCTENAGVTPRIRLTLKFLESIVAAKWYRFHNPVVSIPSRRFQKLEPIENRRSPRPFETTVFKAQLQLWSNHEGDPVIPNSLFQEIRRKHSAIRSRWIVAGLFITCLALFVPRFVEAQASAGITGTVTDPSGAVVPNANVTATNVGTSASTKTVSSSAGTYSFKGLNPGEYTVTVEASGFKKAVQSNVIVEVSKTGTIDFTLTTGATNETVQVTAD